MPIIQLSEGILLVIQVYAMKIMKILAQDARGIQIPNSGHWGPEERPDFVMIKYVQTKHKILHKIMYS